MGDDHRPLLSPPPQPRRKTMRKACGFALTLAVLAIGYSAASNADAIVNELGEDMVHYADDEAPSSPNGGPAPPTPNGYMTNCVTLRAYAAATADQLDDFSEHSLSFMKDILESLAASEHTSDCETVLDQEVAHLESTGPGIAHGMLEAFKESMHNGNGVLIWHSVPKKEGEYVFIDSKRIGLGHQEPMLQDPHGLAIHPHEFT